MSKHLRKFNSISDYNTAKDGQNFFRPSVSLIDATKEVKYDALSRVPEGYVDLGLSVFWSVKNLGATNGETVASWYGNYYAWGEVTTKEDYSWATYTRHTNGTYSNSNKKVFTKYVSTADEETYWGGSDSADNKLVLDSEDDAINVVAGGNYRMPTFSELQELIALTNTWVTDYNEVSGLNGRLLTGTNGNQLFLPASGRYDGKWNIGAGSNGSFWTKSLYNGTPRDAYSAYFYSGDSMIYNNTNRYVGLVIRPVYSLN